MIWELSLGLRQLWGRQQLERVPEPSLVMVNEEQDAEYNRAAFLSGLNISYELILDLLLKRSPLQGRALDIGCGSGQLLLSIAREIPAMHFTGIDSSEAMLMLAKESKAQWMIRNVDFQKADMLNLDTFPDQSFDLITWNNALHHCATEEEAIRVLNAAARLIKDTGTVFIFDLARLKTEKLLVELLNHTAKNLGEHFHNDTYDSYGAAFTYPELAVILRRSHLQHYRHIRPFLLEVFQIVYVSRVRNRVDRRTASRLISVKQKIDHTLLRLMLLGRI